jgi:CubicO group peptidase (beta-lactamase class C family)
MKNSNVSNAVFKPGDNYASPHSRVDGTLQVINFGNLDNAAPAGSINSCAADLAQWVLVQLGRGRLPGSERRLFTEKQSQEMWSAQTVVPVGDPPPSLVALKSNFAAYGLGWALRDYQGRKLVGHTGGVAGFVSRVMLVPQENLGVVVLTNAEEGGAFDSILFHVLDAYFGLPPTDWIAAFKAAQDREEKAAAEVEKRQASFRDAASRPSLPLEAYAGIYADAWYGTATIGLEQGRLVLSFDHTPTMVGQLEHWQYDTFKTHWHDRTIAEAFVSFSLNAEGGIEHFKMKAVSPLADFSFDYQDLLFEPVPKK